MHSLGVSQGCAGGLGWPTTCAASASHPRGRTVLGGGERSRGGENEPADHPRKGLFLGACHDGGLRLGGRRLAGGRRRSRVRLMAGAATPRGVGRLLHCDCEKEALCKRRGE
jgi:hypothetical protein